MTTSEQEGSDGAANSEPTKDDVAVVAGSSSGNILTRSTKFQKLVDNAFVKCDADKSGNVSKSELYVGLLSIHLTLARYAGPAACYPPTREVSDQLFEAADADDSGGISKTEFKKILVVLCAQIMSRMLVYYIVLIMYVPWLSSKVIGSIDIITEDSYLEMVTQPVISISVFVVAVPLLWDFIDSKTETTIDKINNRNSAVTTDDSEAKMEVDKKGD